MASQSALPSAERVTDWIRRSDLDVIFLTRPSCFSRLTTPVMLPLVTIRLDASSPIVMPFGDSARAVRTS